MANQAQLGDVAQFINGAAFKPEDWGTEGLRIIRIQNLTDESKPYNLTTRKVDDKLVVRKGDLLVSWSATLGVFEWQREENGLLNQHIFRVIPNTKVVNKQYLKHVLVSALTDMNQHLHGATMKHVNRGEFLATKIPLPPLAEQQRIAAILDKAEEIKRKREQAIAKLDELAQSTFVEMFGDPVNNSKNWEKVIVADFVKSFESGKSFLTDSDSEAVAEFRILKISAVTSLEYDAQQSKPVPAGYTPPKSHLVRAGDLLFSRANTAELIGATAYVSQTPPNMLLPDKLWRFIWHDVPRAEPLYVRKLFQQDKFRYILGKLATGSSGSMKNISQSKVLSIPVALPPLDLQTEFTTIIKKIEISKSIQIQTLNRAKLLISSLQHQAFTTGFCA